MLFSGVPWLIRGITELIKVLTRERESFNCVAVPKSANKLSITVQGIISLLPNSFSGNIRNTDSKIEVEE